MKMIKRHCQSFVAAVFNIIVHLQSLPIFYDNLASGTVASTPDPASAILMGVEVLVTVSRKDVLFPMDVWHVDNWAVGKDKVCYWLSNDIVGLVGNLAV